MGYLIWNVVYLCVCVFVGVCYEMCWDYGFVRKYYLKVCKVKFFLIRVKCCFDCFERDLKKSGIL